MRIAFDLDGTLIDSIAHIHAAVSAGARDLDLPVLERPVVQGFVGNGLPTLITRVLDHIGEPQARHAALSARVMHHYTNIPTDPDSVFDGVIEALQNLRDAGHHLSVCTNKPFRAALIALGQTGLERFFDLVIGGDSLPTRKPEPEMLRAACPDLFVGDSEVDAATAQNAGTPFLLYTEGYRKSPVEAIAHDARFSHFRDLPILVTRHAPSAEG